VDFGNDVTCGIGFVAVDNIEELMLDEEDPCHVGSGTIILRFKGREIEFEKRELTGMELIESRIVGCTLRHKKSWRTAIIAFNPDPRNSIS